MITPRPYLSFSQMTLVEMSPERYVDQYIHNKKQFVNKNMLYGTKLAEGLENDEATGDPLLDIMMSRIPKFELMDIPFEVDLKDGNRVIRLLAKPDTSKADYSAFKEYKTSVRAWTQRMADKSNQVTFYATCMYLKTGKIPADIELVCVPTQYTYDGGLEPTGEMLVFKTTRTMADIIKMTTRMKKAWKKIEELTERELL